MRSRRTRTSTSLTSCTCSCGEGRSVGVYPYSGYWRDLGRHEDYAAANEEWGDAEGLDEVRADT